MDQGVCLLHQNYPNPFQRQAKCRFHPLQIKPSRPMPLALAVNLCASVVRKSPRNLKTKGKCAPMRWRRSTLASSATTVSKTKTRQNAIRTPYTCDGISGRVLRFRDSKPLFTILPYQRHIPRLAMPMMSADIVEKGLQITPSQIGIAGLNI